MSADDGQTARKIEEGPVWLITQAVGKHYAVDRIPKDLSNLLQVMATDFPAILREDLVGIYLWGSLTYNGFDATCSDVDSIVVTRRDLDDREFSELDEWFSNKRDQNRWVERIDIRFVIENEFLDKTSRCCGFYHHTGKLVRQVRTETRSVG